MFQDSNGDPIWFICSDLGRATFVALVSDDWHRGPETESRSKTVSNGEPVPLKEGIAAESLKQGKQALHVSDGFQQKAGVGRGTDEVRLGHHWRFAVLYRNDTR